ncbi:MAG: hypothetical protein LUD78_10940 [Clostridiales bacterium]|nr:hypothetical protein [Clostridiales bacterium]
MNPKFRLLKPDEISCRVSQVHERQGQPTGVTVLLYKDARCDMDILDETVGPMNWKRHHSRENANCTVSIFDEERCQWVSKEDTGTESNTEKEKGLASDSFKRACVNWGIGRELYTAPRIFIPADRCKIVPGRNGKLACYDRFTVDSISYGANRNINSLTISVKGRVVFEWSIGYQQAPEQPPQPPQKVEPQQYVPCDRCRKPIMGTKGKDGKDITPEQLIQFSKKKFGGAVYCAECQAIIYGQQKARSGA